MKMGAETGLVHLQARDTTDRQQSPGAQGTGLESGQEVYAQASFPKPGAGSKKKKLPEHVSSVKVMTSSLSKFNRISDTRPAG